MTCRKPNVKKEYTKTFKKNRLMVSPLIITFSFKNFLSIESWKMHHSITILRNFYKMRTYFYFSYYRKFILTQFLNRYIISKFVHRSLHFLVHVLAKALNLLFFPVWSSKNFSDFSIFLIFYLLNYYFDHSKQI